MRKAITIAALLALLAVPFWAVAANERPALCHQKGGGGWRVIPPNDESYEAHKEEHGDFEIDDNNPCPPVPPLPIELFNNCTRWVVKQGDEELEKSQWTDPFVLEVQFSTVLDQRVYEPERCLQVRPTPSPEPEPTATPEPGPTATPVPQGCWNTGDNICPGDDDDDPEEHPATGGEIDAGLAVVTALSGLTLAGIGGSILFIMKRRASR